MHFRGRKVFINITQHDQKLSQVSPTQRESSEDDLETNETLEELIAQSLEDSILEPDENQIDASSVAPSSSSIKTFYTTYTYFTTLFRNGTSYVTSNLETVTNTADATASPTLVQPR